MYKRICQKFLYKSPMMWIFIFYRRKVTIFPRFNEILPPEISLRIPYRELQDIRCSKFLQNVVLQ